MSRVGSVILSVALVAMTACSGGGSSGSSSASSSQSAAASCVATSWRGDIGFGLSVLPPIDAGLWAAIDDLGVKTLRLDLLWKDVEPTEGHQDWSAYERFMVEASQHHVNVLLIINHPPDWALADSTQFAVRTQRFALSAGAWARNRVAGWEVFNEPNLPGHGWPFTTLSLEQDAALYAQVVSAVNTGLRGSGDPAPVLAGALSPAGYDPAAFIDAVFSRLDSACYDAVSIHPYGGMGRLLSIRQAVRDQLQALTGHQVPVWITEYGTDSPADQDAVLADLLATFGRNESVFWFTLRDISANEQYGLIDGAGKPRPAYATLKAALLTVVTQ